MNELKLKMGTDVISNGRTFTKLIGGFSDNKPCITINQISELLDKNAKHINERININIEHFEFGTHIIDLKNSVGQTDPVYEVLKSQGYSKQSISNSKNIYILSQAGFLLYLKFADGDKAISLYKDFIEDYFTLKARVELLEKTLEKELEELIRERKLIAGELIYSEDTEDRFKISMKRKSVDKRIEDIKIAIATRNKDILLEQYKPKVAKWERFLESNGTYSFTEVSKLLSTMAIEEKSNIEISVIKLTEFLRNKGVLNKSKTPDRKDKKGIYKNLPNKPYETYFNVVSIETNGGFNKTQTKVKAHGVEYIYDLVKDEYQAV